MPAAWSGVSSGSISGSLRNGRSLRKRCKYRSFGGLVGWNNGSSSIIQNSYATGTVSSGTEARRTGGLVGQNNGKVFDSYATGNVSGGTQGSGGLVGYNAIGATIARTYAAGTVNASAPWVGWSAAMTAALRSPTGTRRRQDERSASGADHNRRGRPDHQPDAGPHELATTYAGWDFATVWSAPSAGYYPQLYGVNYVLRVDPANASRVYGDANPAFTYTSYGLHTGDTSAILAGLSLSTAATTTSNVGSYAITAGGSVISTAGQAYRLIQTPAALTVTPARDHGDGRRQEPRLWRCQSGADLSGRRRGSGQRRQAVGRTGDVGDDSEQCRHLRHQRRARSRPRPTMR